MYKFELGNQSESVILAAYLRAGFTVNVPVGSGASCDQISSIEIYSSGMRLYVGFAFSGFEKRVRPARIELATFRFGAERSIH